MRSKDIFFFILLMGILILHSCEKAEYVGCVHIYLLNETGESIETTVSREDGESWTLEVDSMHIISLCDVYEQTKFYVSDNENDSVLIILDPVNDEVKYYLE